LTGPGPGRFARVVTDVAGIDKEFDYSVPASLDGELAIGTEVRVPLAGRRVGGWVVGFPGDVPEGVTARPIAKRRGHGPEPELVDLARWAAWRWAGKPAWFLRTASAGRAVTVLASPGGPPRPPAPPPRLPLEPPAGAGTHIVRLGPATDPTPLVAAVAQRGPTLVVVPTAARAAVLTGRLRRAGGDVALLPDDWGRARGGRAAVVIGARAAAWGPCPGLAAVVVVDAHDEALTSEGAPTWNAVAVAAERARRAAVPFYALTACPTLELQSLGPVTAIDRGSEIAAWALIEVIDRRDDDPRLGLWSERLTRLVHDEGRVACILNRTGRLRLLACGACGDLARCEKCEAAVASPEAGTLRCPRCGYERPPVCARCGSTRLRSLRIGVGRAREELESLSGRPVGEVTSATAAIPGADVLVGTEALLRRLDPGAGLDAVAFVDFDQELLAPRVKADEEALALLAMASRLVRGRRGRILAQTRVPDHPVLTAAVHADPGALAAPDGPGAAMRRALRFPPFAALAVVHGDAASGWVPGLDGVTVEGPDPEGRWLVRAPDHPTLCDALAAHPRPLTGTLRVAVEPARI
jgi:primosomal protein N' (replication factor Y)